MEYEGMLNPRIDVLKMSIISGACSCDTRKLNLFFADEALDLSVWDRENSWCHDRPKVSFYPEHFGFTGKLQQWRRGRRMEMVLLGKRKHVQTHLFWGNYDSLCQMYQIYQIYSSPYSLFSILRKQIFLETRILISKVYMNLCRIWIDQSYDSKLSHFSKDSRRTWTLSSTTPM